MMTIFGLTNAFDFASIREIQSLKQNSFAASLIETISLSLSSSKGNGVAEVLKMLQDLKTQLTTDQTNDDRIYAAKTLLNTQIAALEARIQVLTGLIAQAKINIQSFTDRIDNLKQSIVDIDVKLVEDRKYYTSRAAGLQQVHDKLLVVNERLGEMVGSVSGVGIKGHIAQTEAEKRDIAWSKAHAKSFIQLSKTIPMVASKLAGTFIQADQKALQRLMGIIAKFAQQALDERQEA